MPSSAGAGAPAGRALGKYTLLGRLAQGGMGEILLARLGGAAGFEKYVVIKRLRGHLDGDERSVQAFLDEARIVARISHPNVCQVHELGVEGGRYYLAMEYLEGLPLSGIIRRANRDRAPLDLRAVSGMVEQASEGLHHAHNLRRMDGAAAAVLHRDVSPQNLFVTVDGVVKVLDFGIAKSGDSSVKTPTGRIMGKSAYMSPEQIRGAPLDQRSDVYSLGVVLYEAVTGQPLFDRGDVAETFRAIREDTLPFLRDVPDQLNGVIQRAIARERDERFDSARALGRALGAAVSGLGGSMSPPQLAEWLDQQFADDLRERRERAAHAAAGGRAGTLDDPGERIEPGTVIFHSGPLAADTTGLPPLATSGTMPLAARSDELWSDPAMSPAGGASPASARFDAAGIDARVADGAATDGAAIDTRVADGAAARPAAARPAAARPTASRRRSWPWLAGGAAALLVVGAIAARAARDDDATDGQGSADQRPDAPSEDRSGSHGEDRRAATDRESPPPTSEAAAATDRDSHAATDRESPPSKSEAGAAATRRAKPVSSSPAATTGQAPTARGHQRSAAAPSPRAPSSEATPAAGALAGQAPSARAHQRSAAAPSPRAPPSEATPAADALAGQAPTARGHQRSAAAPSPRTPSSEATPATGALAGQAPTARGHQRSPAAPSPLAPSSEASPAAGALAAPAPAERRAGRRAHARGYFTIDSMPYATIYIDGVAHGVTPLLRVSLAPGSHTVVAVTADGRRRSLRVKIEPGVEAPRRRLVW
ncbi:MAG TPA: protein kinase [Kofleriaceae bacterium]|nr:protein kinase [Kofleriaceae bacterium]